MAKPRNQPKSAAKRKKDGYIEQGEDGRWYIVRNIQYTNKKVWVVFDDNGKPPDKPPMEVAFRHALQVMGRYPDVTDEDSTSARRYLAHVWNLQFSSLTLPSFDELAALQKK